MEFLGSQIQQLRAMRSQILAQDALLHALIDALDEDTSRALQHHFDIRAEEARAKVLNSMATDTLYEQLLLDLEKYLQTINRKL